MKDNRFERLYGFVFRSLAKSILQEFVKDNDKEYLTIGILQYHSYDDSFSYAPTFKNCLLLPNEIDSLKFPTEKLNLWNYELMEYLGVYLSLHKANDWVQELFEESRAISKENDSTYSITYDEYDVFISSWEAWYNDNFINSRIDIQSKLKTSEYNKLLIQTFYFGSYLLTITYQIAFGSPADKRTYAEGMYLCHCNPMLLKENDIFDKRTGYMVCGENIPWSKQPQRLIHKAELNQVLEICFRWPFGVADKINVLKVLIDRFINSPSNQRQEYYLNATAVPLNYHGEFLGICYLSQPSNENQNNNIANEAEKLKKKVDASKITGILYQSRYTTARLSLQKINEESYKEETIFRVFNLSHLYTSAPIVALIDEEDNLFIRSRDEKERISKMQTTKLTKKGSELLNILPSIKGHNLLKQSFSWYDIYDDYITEDKKNEAEAYTCINLFNSKLFEFIKESNPVIPKQYKITSITFLRIEVNDAFYSLLFFNSNFIQLYKTKTSSTAKQSYALTMHNNIKQLIETEQIYRLIYLQNKQFQDVQRKGLIHYFKNFINYVLLSYLSQPLLEEKRFQLVDICNNLVNRFTGLIQAFNSTKIHNESLSISEIRKIWDEVTIAYSQHKISFSFTCTDLNSVVYSSKECLHVIFSELINNALKEYRREPLLIRNISLTIVNEFPNVKFIIQNSDTSIRTNYIKSAGIDIFSRNIDNSTGLGLRICEERLEKMDAVKIGNRHFIIDNIENPKACFFEFLLRGVPL